MDNYTVKYVGVVEGSMGILSRKMRMPTYKEARTSDSNPLDVPIRQNIERHPDLKQVKPKLASIE